MERDPNRELTSSEHTLESKGSTPFNRHGKFEPQAALAGESSVWNLHDVSVG